MVGRIALRHPQGREKLFPSFYDASPLSVCLPSPTPLLSQMGTRASFSQTRLFPLQSYREHKKTISDLTFPCAVNSNTYWIASQSISETQNMLEHPNESR